MASSVSSTEDNENRLFKFKVSHIMNVSNVASLLASRQKLVSRSLTCPEDPQSTSFQMELSFGADEENHLSVFMKPNKDVYAGMSKYIIYDDNINIILAKVESGHAILNSGEEFGWDRLLSLENVGDVNWTIMCEQHYSPISETTELFETEMSQFSKNMLTLLDDPEDADVKFCVESDGRVEEIKAHKNILVAQSTFFRSLFRSRMAESVTKEIRIEDPAAPFKEMLKFIYTGVPPKNLNEIAMDLLPLADKYLLDNLKRSCVEELQRTVSEDNVIDILLVAERLNLSALLRFCVPVFKVHVKTLESGIHWTKLKENPELLAKLLVYCCE